MQFSRRDLLKAGGVMIIGFSALGEVAALAAPSARSEKPGMLDSWLVISRDDMVTVYSGRIDMGTGLQTAYAQIVADELDVPLTRIRVIMGDTTTTPDQGKTTASNGIMVGAQPIRVAACEARAALIKMAAERLKVSVAELDAKDGAVRVRGAPGKSISFGKLIGDNSLSFDLGPVKESPWGPTVEGQSPLKSPRDYKVVGASVPRIDIPAKVAGSHEYVHNVRVPGMLHGRVVRPSAVGAKLVAVDESSVSAIPGVRIVRRADFLGVVAPPGRERHSRGSADQSDLVACTDAAARQEGAVSGAAQRGGRGDTE
jgi:CO/xanthine dehydrogenase Mo-binding subunit